ncbi:hypothetical protein [Prosthecochloris sp.]|uniref:hypothetical protein n=1 Tax=Prosthecochloris sp. TaxID=290513 RepID=UPI0025FA2273|nr:hypothetical protein [Prosthecochloris sp.]
MINWVRGEKPFFSGHRNIDNHKRKKVASNMHWQEIYILLKVIISLRLPKSALEDYFLFPHQLCIFGPFPPEMISNQKTAMRTAQQ